MSNSNTKKGRLSSQFEAIKSSVAGLVASATTPGSGSLKSPSEPNGASPPAAVPGSDPALDRDTLEFFNAVQEVRLTESGIEKEMGPGGTLEAYSLIPDPDNSVTYDMWLGGIHNRTIIIRGTQLTGMAFATLEKKASCAWWRFKLDVAPCCGLCRCFLHRRYKLAVTSTGDAVIVNDFPQRPPNTGANWIRGCCLVCNCVTCGQYESKETHTGTLCVTQTKDGARIQRMEEGIRREREVGRASIAGAQRRGLEKAMSEVITDEDVFFRKWCEKEMEDALPDVPPSDVPLPDAPPPDLSSNEEVPPATVPNVNFSKVEIDHEAEPPMAVAVPLEPMKR